MRQEAQATLSAEHVPPERQHLRFALDLRYVGQYHEVNVPIGPVEVEALPIAALAERFHARHDQLYGYAVPGAPVEMVTVRLTALGETLKPRLPSGQRRAASSAHALKGQRQAYLPAERAFAAVPVYDGAALDFGSQLDGPALVELETTTVFVPGEYRLMCDPLGSFALFLKSRAAEFEARLAEL
jgi:N-methylhydantoinase A